MHIKYHTIILSFKHSLFRSMINKKKHFSWRKLFNDIHLWLGIGSGLILFLVCLSGTLYTFRAEVEALLEPSKYYVDADEQTQRLPPETIIEKMRESTGGKVTSIEIPHDRNSVYKVSIKMSEEERRGTTYYVDPFTATIKGTDESPASGFFMFMFRMHRWLLLDTEIGRPIVGTATLIFAFIVLTGLVLWWPKKLKNWKQGFKIKTDAHWKRINHDLHNTLGFYTFLLLLIMSLTGLCWSFEWYREGLSHVLGAEVFGGRGEKPLVSGAATQDTRPLSVTDYLRMADQQLPYAGDYRLSLPDNAESAIVINKYRTGFFALSAPDKLQLDQHTGQTLSLEKFADKPFHKKIASSIKPLHTGEILGTFSKILYALACLIATSLPVTGTIIWINKLKKKAKKKSKTTSQKRSYQPAGDAE